jgi:hypothetical protein
VTEGVLFKRSGLPSKAAWGTLRPRLTASSLRRNRPLPEPSPAKARDVLQFKGGRSNSAGQQALHPAPSLTELTARDRGSLCYCCDAIRLRALSLSPIVGTRGRILPSPNAGMCSTTGWLSSGPSAGLPAGSGRGAGGELSDRRLPGARRAQPFTPMSEQLYAGAARTVGGGCAAGDEHGLPRLRTLQTG